MMMLMMKMSADIEFFNIYAIKVAAKIALCCGWCQRGRGNNGCKRRAASNYMPLARSLSPLLARAPLHKFYTQKTKPKWIISCKLRIQIFLIFLLKKKIIKLSNTGTLIATKCCKLHKNLIVYYKSFTYSNRMPYFGHYCIDFFAQNICTSARTSRQTKCCWKNKNNLMLNMMIWMYICIQTALPCKNSLAA